MPHFIFCLDRIIEDSPASMLARHPESKDDDGSVNKVLELQHVLYHTLCFLTQIYSKSSPAEHSVRQHGARLQLQGGLQRSCIQDHKPKYSWAAGLSVPLSSPRKQWAKKCLSKNTWASFLLKLSPLLCLLTVPSARDAFLNWKRFETIWERCERMPVVVYQPWRISG